MYKKIGIIILISFIFALSQNATFAFRMFKKAPKKAPVQQNEIVFAPINNINENRVWVGTFQLVWNDLINEVIGSPIEFSGFKSDLADKLNKQGFTSSSISDDSYYKKHGKISLRLKREIERELKKKFNEKSDILGGIDWNTDGLLVYAMLKKDFKYLKEFNELDYDLFEGEKVKFFGINKNGNRELRNNVEVLFYNSNDSFAVKLNTQNNDEIILYRTDYEDSFEGYLKEFYLNAGNFKGNTNFTSSDSIKIPYIKFENVFKYDELSNKPIQGTDYVIDSAIQAVKFKMDNKGGSLKSEAAVIATMSLAPVDEGRNFNFNKPFVLFLKEKGQNIPYFIVHFKNADLFEKKN